MSTPRSASRRTSEERLDRIFHALSDGTRRALLAKLHDEPAAITALAKPFAMSLPAVSKHIRVLEAAGLVRRTIDGRVHHCSLDPAPLKAADRWLERYRDFWRESLKSLARFVEKEDA